MFSDFGSSCKGCFDLTSVEMLFFVGELAGIFREKKQRTKELL